MIKGYIIYISSLNYSGYYTGKNYFLPTGEKYPGIASVVGSPAVKIYSDINKAKNDGLGLSTFCGNNFSFEILDKSNLNTIYEATYNNGKLESEQLF